MRSLEGVYEFDVNSEEGGEGVVALSLTAAAGEGWCCVS